MIQVDALGDACPIPVVKTKKAIAALNGGGQVEVLVDNEIAVQNLTKLARQKGYAVTARKEEEKRRAEEEEKARAAEKEARKNTDTSSQMSLW